MWAVSLLTIVLLFPLLSAAPLDIAGGVKDDDGMHSHDENVTRAGKFFGHNQFDVGNINVPGSVEGDDVSIGHQVNIDVHGHTHDSYHHEDDSVIECKEGLLEMFKSIDSNKDGVMDAEELLRVCHQNNIQITESLAVGILTLPDKTVGFNVAKFCELLKDCQSNNSAGLIHFLLQLFDKGTIEEHEISPPRPQPKDTIEEHYEISPPRPQPKVTCPYKDDLSSVLLENNWRTQNQINLMSYEDKRNTVIVEVEQMTGHTIADLQGRDDVRDLGSLISIANMAALLNKYSIKSSSEVKTMTYEPHLRNTLIVEASQRFSIQVSELQSMTDLQLLKTFCTVTIEEREISPTRPKKDTIEEQHESSSRPQPRGCKVHVGKSTWNTISATVTEGCVCPAVVNKGNWLGEYTHPDEFKVTQDGSSLQVQRTDFHSGWGMDLTFMCYQVSCSGTESDWDCCSSTSPCKANEGDCDTDDDCVSSLVCGKDNCKSINPLAHPEADCCIPVCTPDAVNSDACFCKSSTGGESCSAGQRCKKHGTCQSVITECGIETPEPRQKASGDSFEISGGSETRPNQYPWMVWLPMGCGGSLITDIHILTAKHCVDRYVDRYNKRGEKENYRGKKVRVGVHHLHKDYQEVFIKNYVWPDIKNSDIAIIILDTPVNLNNKKIGTVCLPSSANKDYRGQRGTAMGWGLDHKGAGPQSPFLHHVKLTVSQKEETNYLYTEVEVVDGVPLDPCAGDSGGPLIHREFGRWTIIGTVVGNGYDCDDDTFGEGKYEKGKWNKITDHLVWIHSVIGN